MKSIAAAIAALGALVTLTGCPGDSAVPTLASVTGRYESGQYELALQEADTVAARGPDADRAQADLVAGMAAFQLERFGDAERRFTAAERSGNQTIRGRARVMLANIRLEQGRTDDAARLFESGAADLTGADAEKARRYAALARDGQLGTGQPHATITAADPPAVAPGAPPGAPATPASEPPRVAVAARPVPPARPAQAPQTDAAQAVTRGTTVPAAATPAPTVPQAAGIFTVRAGAYTTEAAARRRVKALAADVRRAKSPDPHIAAVATRDGDTLYAVRIGSFRSRAEAEALLKRLARKDLAVGAI